MDFRLLGPLEVESGGSFVRIAGAKERAVLASLLLHANRLVSRDRLVDALWGERPPATARHTLEVYVSRLRRALSTAGGGALIESQPGGYRLRLTEDELDVLRFERRLEEGRTALAQGALAEAEAKLTAALRLWRGEVLADLVFEPFAAGEVDRLEELHMEAREAHSAAALALGRHAELVGELRSLVVAHPFREELRGQLMLALYRSGRQADALAVFLEGRRQLVDELGIEPGRQLQELQGAILRQDPALDQPAVATDETASPVTEPVAAPPPLVRPLRKVVTVVVCELSESTGLAQRLDPEALAALLERYFERLKAIAEGHGGTAAKSIGDTLVAQFGVPLLHEDDALRACRAATEMCGALPELGVGGRIGIATGEVIVGTEERLATGAAVQLAAQLAHAARRDEILLGAETVRMLGPLVEFEPVAPVTLRGKAGAAAFRFLRLAAPAERALTRFVDRERELALLAEAFRRAAEERELHLLTLLGPAGIGKSRLVREFVDSLPARTQVARGRCLSYGQAITYWPLMEVLRAIGEPARLALERVVSGGASSPQQLAWTVKQALEHAAADQPLVVVVDDVHWAEPALLDLLDAVCERSRGYPILLLCVARPELFEQRAGWGGGKLSASTVLLESLASEDSELLVDALQRPLDAHQRQRVVQTAAGNPLFLKELTEFVAEGGSGDLPPRIHALLQARLDRLPEQERFVLCCAAVEGSVFHAGGLGTLAPELRAELGPLLAALTRKLLVRPVPSELEEEAAFRFRHQLIRDAAYAVIPKGDRARLHERFADWLERHTVGRAELAEIAAYHLEQAAHAKREVGARDPVLDARAAAHLAAAAERAGRRTDLRAAEGLWRRSLTLLDPDDPQASVLELELGEVLTRLGRLDDARHLLERASRGVADPAVAAAIRLARLRAELFAAPEGPAAVRTACADAIPLLEQRGDHRALAQAWHALAMAERSELRIEAAAQAYANAAEQAHRAGDLAFEAFELGLRLTMLGESRIPYAVAARELAPVAARFPGEPFLEAMLAGLRGLAAFHDGRRERAQSLIRAALDGCRRAGYTPVAMGVAVRNGRIELVAGDIDEAERFTLGAIDEQRQVDLGFLGHAKAVLAEIRIEQGRYREALQLTDEAAGTGGIDSRMAAIVANSARARAHARLGETEQAKSAAADAVATASATESLDAQARADCALAEVLTAADELPAALAAADEADRLYTILDRTLERRQVAGLEAQIKRRIARANAPTPAA